MSGRRAEIESGKLVVFMIDECHLLWDDISGYVWGQTSERISIPVVNAREKQTYFGALDYKTKEFITYKAKKGDSENTINFLEYLKLQRPKANSLIIWDGVSYHRSQQIKDYLDSLNSHLESEQWLITCERFARLCTTTKSCRGYLVAGKKINSRVLFSLSFFLCSQGFILSLSKLSNF